MVLLPSLLLPCRWGESSSSSLRLFLCCSQATELDLDRRRVRWGLNGTWFAYRPLLRQQGSYWFGASLLPQCTYGSVARSLGLAAPCSVLALILRVGTHVGAGVIEVVPNPEWALSAVRR